jgi:hypothetical protein
MATPRKITKQQAGNAGPAGNQPNPGEEALGEQLIREARQGHLEFLAGWTQFMNELGIQGKPVGAKKLREMPLPTGINPDDNQFSRGIIAMREE